jgi:membrane protein YqaA with SNARE-associated domain
MSSTPSEVKWISARTKYILISVVFLLITAASIYLIIRYNKEIVELRQYGYLGAFVVAFVAGSSVPIPVSYLLLLFTLGGIRGLNPAFIALSAGFGAGIGGTLLFLLGRGGSRFFPGMWRYSMDERASLRWSDRFAAWAHRRGSIVVFLMSALLNPAFGPMAIAMGALRFRVLKFLTLCVAGNLVKAFVVTYAGYLGIGTLIHFFGG